MSETLPTNHAALAAELANLWTVHRFLTSLQAITLQEERPLSVNLQDLNERLEALKEATDPTVFGDIRQYLIQARVEITMTDLTLPPSVFRRFFERVVEYDRSMLAEILRYYIDKTPKNSQDRDKVDLIATRLCTYSLSGDHSLKLIACLPDTVQIITKAFPGNAADFPPPDIQEAMLNALRRVARTVTEARNFNALIDGHLVSQLRQCKIDLGDNFYIPAVLAEVVNINTAVHNKFQELYNQEQARLRMESVRLMRTSLGNTKAVTDAAQHPALVQVHALTVTLQRHMQDFKHDIATRVLNDRQARVELEEADTTITELVRQAEESIIRIRERVDEIQRRLDRLSGGER